MNAIILIPLIIAVILTMPTWPSRSVKSFLVALFHSIFGIVLPLLVFLFSSFFAAQSKNEAVHGWIDCFWVGKLALAPLVLWATVSFFATRIYRVEKPEAPQFVLGYFLGAIVSCACLVMGFISISHELRSNGLFSYWMLVPIYVAIWYSTSAVALMAKARLKPKTYLTALAGSSPLWVASVWWSRMYYESLPQTQGCFVVTAASRGHCRVVGPFFGINRHGHGRIANHQLLTFWLFEEILRRHFPRAHAFLRRIYNVVGPAVARHIKGPWLADIVYFALKPSEVVAAICIRLEQNFFKNAREAATKKTEIGL